MEKWSEKKAQAWIKNTGWLRGFNYRPADCANSFEIFQEYGFDRHLPYFESEFKLAAEIGFNTMRLIVSYPVWRDQHDGFMSRLDTVLSIAYKHGISTMLTFGNDCCPPKENFKYPTYGPQTVDWGYHGGIKASPHKTYGTHGYNFMVDEPDEAANVLKMVQEIVTKYAHDPKVVIWDIFNEPGNGKRGSMSLNAMRDMFAVARKCDPDQPLTAGIWAYEVDFDKSELILSECQREIQQAALDLSDVISYHDYGKFERTACVIKCLQKYNRPLFNTEWLNRVCSNDIAEQYPTFMMNMIGCYCWGLVLGKSQTNEPYEAMWQQLENGTLPHDWDLSRWMHDLFRINHRPYDPKEIELIKKFNKFADNL